MLTDKQIETFMSELAKAGWIFDGYDNLFCKSCDREFEGFHIYCPECAGTLSYGKQKRIDSIKSAYNKAIKYE